MLLMLSHQETQRSIKENLISDTYFCMNRRTSPSISIQEFWALTSDQCGHVRLTVFGVAVCWGGRGSMGASTERRCLCCFWSGTWCSDIKCPFLSSEGGSPLLLIIHLRVAAVISQHNWSPRCQLYPSYCPVAG